MSFDNYRANTHRQTHTEDKLQYLDHEVVTLASCCSTDGERHIAAATYRITLTHAGYSLYFTMGRRVSPKIVPSLGDSPPNTWLPGPTRFHMPHGISIGSGVLEQLMVVVTNRYTRYLCVSSRRTDRRVRTQTPERQGNNRPHLYTLCVRRDLMPNSHRPPDTT